MKELAPYLAVGAHLSLISKIFSVLSVCVFLELPNVKEKTLFKEKTLEQE